VLRARGFEPCTHFYIDKATAAVAPDSLSLRLPGEYSQRHADTKMIFPVANAVAASTDALPLMVSQASPFSVSPGNPELFYTGAGCVGSAMLDAPAQVQPVTRAATVPRLAMDAFVTQTGQPARVAAAVLRTGHPSATLAVTPAAGPMYDLDSADGTFSMARAVAADNGNPSYHAPSPLSGAFGLQTERAVMDACMNTRPQTSGIRL